MGLLDQLDNASAAAEEKAPGEVWKNVALRVTGYDIKRRVTQGVDISTGEALEIKLDGADRPGRDDIDEWSKTRFEQKGKFIKLVNNKAVVAGDETEAGVIIFEAVRPSKEPGLLEARWSVTASHSAEEASVHAVLARPMSAWKAPGQLDKSLGIEVIRPLTAAPVKDIESITEAITSIVAAPFTHAVIRAQDENGKIHASVVRRPYTDELKALNAQINAAAKLSDGSELPYAEARAAKTEKRRSLTEQFAIADKNAIEGAAPAFWKFDPLGKLLAKLSLDDLATLKLEAFALENIYPGAKYKEALDKETGVDNMMLRRDWKLPEDAGTGFGFTDTFLAIRVHEEGGSQVTKIRASSTRPLLYPDLASIPTPNITPTTAPVLSNRAGAESASPESAPAAEDSVDAGISEKLQAASRAYGPR